MGIWEIVLCFFAAVGLVCLCWAIFGVFLRPGQTGIETKLDLSKIPQSRWEQTIRFFRWLWDFDLLPGIVSVRLPKDAPEEFMALLVRCPFVRWETVRENEELE